MLFSLNGMIVFNIIEYFSYLNLWLVLLFLFIIMFFLLVSSAQLINSSRLCSDVVLEVVLVLFCLLFIAVIISPALIILLDWEITIIPSFIIYVCGYQWAWTFTMYYLDWSAYLSCDHYIQTAWYIAQSNLYLASTNELLILPLLLTIQYYVFSYDVIHSLGIYSFGIKIDAIPGRFNVSGTIRTLIKGEHRGLCYELCGSGHNTMLIISNVMLFINNLHNSFNFIFSMVLSWLIFLVVMHGVT